LSERIDSSHAGVAHVADVSGHKREAANESRGRKQTIDYPRRPTVL